MERKVSIRLSKCEPGMKIAETVFNDYGAVVVAKDSILDAHMIAKMQNFNIDRVLIYEISDDKIEENKNKFKKDYNKKVDTLKDIIKDISTGKDLQVEKVDSIVNTLLANKDQNRDILHCINEVRDVHEYTYTHCMNVSIISMMIGKWLNYDDKKIKDLVYAGLLHDIGKARVNLNILNKPAKLTPEEFEEIKKHVLFGYRILENIPNLGKNIAIAVLMHHEREDGTGYLLGVKGNQIHEYAKIVAVADVFDAMTSNRVYRAKESPFEVFEHIQRGTFGQFEPKITLTFLSHIASYYVGDRCRLNTGEEAEIIQINNNNVSRPLIKVGEEYIDLTKQPEKKIVELI